MLTSTIAGISAMGGGMLLVMLLPYFVPSAAVIPLHGVFQLASNGSRLLFNVDAIYWPFVRQFVVGAIVGTSAVYFALIHLTSELIPLAIACYLLLTLWSSAFAKLVTKIENFYVLGALQTGLGLVVGAPGPMTVTFLYKKLDDKNQVIATASLLMGLTNANKIIVYALIGFQFFEFSSLMVAGITGAIVGSIVGTYMRNRIPEHWFMPLIKLTITLLAIHTLARYGFQQLN